MRSGAADHCLLKSEPPATPPTERSTLQLLVSRVAVLPLSIAEAPPELDEALREAPCEDRSEPRQRPTVPPPREVRSS